MDTSVLVAFYIPEALSPQVDRLMRGLEGPAISNLTELEIASAVARRLRDGGITRRSAEEVLREFEAHVRRGLYRRVLVGDEHFEKARREIGGLRLPLETLDGLHLAVCALGRYQMVTADSQMARNARALGLAAQLLTPAAAGGEGAAGGPDVVP